MKIETLLIHLFHEDIDTNSVDRYSCSYLVQTSILNIDREVQKGGCLFGKYVTIENGISINGMFTFKENGSSVRPLRTRI